MEHNDAVKSKGIHILSVCNAKPEKARRLQAMIEAVRLKREHFVRLGILTENKMKELWDEYSFLIKELHKDFLLRQFAVENITVTAGRTVLARRLSGSNTYTGNINYTALGSDATAPVVGNTQLGTEVYRKALSSGTYLANVAYIETFFTASETSGTYQEYGNFIDGTGTVNSGQLFNRFTQAVTKSLTETLNVQSQITFNDA